MPFLISGNLDLVERHSLKKMEKFLGIILSPVQFPVEQYNLLRHALHRNLDPDALIRKMNRQELLSFIYILTQFGDVVRAETPAEYLNVEKIPLVLEWQKGQYMIPYEVLDHLSTSRIFKNQNYLFALIPSLPIKEKKPGSNGSVPVMVRRFLARSIMNFIFNVGICKNHFKVNPYLEKNLLNSVSFGLLEKVKL